MQSGKVTTDWNSKSVVNLIREMATQEEDGASKRIFARAVSYAPIGQYEMYRYPKARTPLARRGKYSKSGFKKDWQRREAGSLMRSIERFTSKFGAEGGKLVWAGNERLVYYAHFVEFGTVHMQKRKGYRFMRRALENERRMFLRKLKANLAGDIR